MKKVLLTMVFLCLILFVLVFAVYADGTSPAVRSITIESYPTRTVYGAFDRFDSTGLVVYATLEDGSRREIPNSDLSFSYETGETFRAGDGHILIGYMGRQARLPVTVNRIAYPLDTTVSDVTLTYNGKHQSYSEALPTIIGKDGIALGVSAVGGGTDVGEYEIFIDFSTESKDYLTPESRVVKMTIKPLEVNLSWGETKFVYDGKSKSPSAEYTDVFGNRIPLSVLGGAINAGSYTAKVSSTDPNYVFNNTTQKYEIAKAEYDMSGAFWNGTSYVYDGNKRSVTLHGLPHGVSVLRYEGDVASDAGKYTARAILSWDEANYNAPSVKEHNWEITRADYDLSGFKFAASSFTYDGNMHYPTLEGKMPVGADGLVLEYSFSGGAIHVSEGKVSVIISFNTDSKNYNTPKDQYSSVSIKPRGINVQWSKEKLYYNAERQAPIATAGECALKVLGGALTVGKYKAKAESLNSDYYVVNADYEFEILKAQNSWKTAPAASTCYEGREIKLIGESRFGTPSYIFYSDPTGRNKIPAPTASGKYYARLEVADTMNYYGLESQIIPFEIVPITPVSFIARIDKQALFAFDSIKAEDLICSVINNDGSTDEINSSEVKIVYQNGDSLRKKDEFVTLIYDSFSLKLPIEVGLATYNLTAVTWGNTVVKYNGKPQLPTISGLPEGVSLIGIAGDDMVSAGVYTVTAVLDYDRENYNQPILPQCRFTIERQAISAPKLTSTYNGKHQIPSTDSLLYEVSSDKSFRDAGIYSVTLRLLDSNNYVFAESGEDRVNAIFEITPATVTVKLDNVKLHLFERLRSAGYKIIGGRVFEGDYVGLDFYLDGSRVMASSQNGNYVLDVHHGDLIRLPYPTLLDGLLMGALLLLVLLIIFGLCLLYKKRAKLATVIGIIKCRIRHRHFKASEPTDEVRVIPTPIKEEKIGQSPFGEDNISIPVDEPHADMLITDPQAKSLLKKDGDVIYTDGVQKARVSVGEISQAFEEGDTIDINSMKEKGIVPADAGSVKITSEGKIDKALTVYANDFALSAVKMIALSGGQAIKCITLRQKPVNEKE